MTKITIILHESLSSAMIFCRLFGLGLLHNYTAFAYFKDTILLAVNLIVAVYGYRHVTYFISIEMQEIWNITAVVSVVRVYIHMIIPPLLVFLVQFKKRALTNIINQIDDLLPQIETDFLRSFRWYCVKWLLLKALTEMIALVELHIKTRHFNLSSINDYLLVLILNIWLLVPLFQYIFIIKTVHLGVCEINHRIISIKEWTIYRQKWKELTYLVIHLTKNVFGDIIILHIGNVIINIIFFIFSLYYYGYKRNSLFVMCSHSTNILVIVFWLFELFRQCENCKKEVM